MGRRSVIAKEKNRDAFGAGTTVLESDWRWKAAERAARSSALQRATQLREMLLYIVRQSIISPDEPIHESEIAHRVLGRRSDFNPLDDNIVRVQMAHLRKKLDLYFSTEGKQEETIITVALGSYRPVFSPRTKAAIVSMPPGDSDATYREAPAVDEDGSSIPPARVAHQAAPETKAGLQAGRFAWSQITAAALIVALAAGCLALWIRDKRQKASLDAMQRALSPWRYQPALSALWSGFFDTSRDTDVVISDDTFLLIEELNKQQTSFYGYQGRTYLSPLPGKLVSPEMQSVQALLASKSLGNTGEFKLAHRILDLDPLDERLKLYSARQYMPALVKQDNVILIGGRISNPWSELFEGRLNFIENTKFEGLGVTSVTNRAPMAGEPQTYTSTDQVGYCVVAYLPNPGHEGKVLLLEGTSSEATEAAGDFLLSQDQFSAFKNLLHVDELPYFEVLLKTSQVRGTPLTATVEAYRTYPNLPRRSP
jgi:hypothetical protein